MKKFPPCLFSFPLFFEGSQSFSTDSYKSHIIFLTFHWLVVVKDAFGLYFAIAEGCSFGHGHGHVFLSFLFFLVGPTERKVQDNLKEILFCILLVTQLTWHA